MQNWAKQLVRHPGILHSFSYVGKILPLSHLDTGLFDPEYYSGNLQGPKRAYDQIRGSGGPDFQAARAWDLTPTMSFGNLSKWYSSLADRATRQSISNNYGLDEATLRSVLRHLTSIRNTCAHHERIWNLTVKPGLRIPRELGGSRETARSFNKNALGKVYNALVMITYLMEVITPNGDWPERLLTFREAEAYNSVPHSGMEFPTSWREFTIWQRHLTQEQESESSSA